jgi:hypothetical protein
MSRYESVFAPKEGFSHNVQVIRLDVEVCIWVSGVCGSEFTKMFYVRIDTLECLLLKNVAKKKAMK